MEAMNFNGFLVALGRASVQAGVLVLLVLLIQWLLRKHLTPRWRCALWLLVVARLLLPVSFTSAASLFNWLPLQIVRGENGHTGYQPAPSGVSPHTQATAAPHRDSGAEPVTSARFVPPGATPAPPDSEWSVRTHSEPQPPAVASPPDRPTPAGSCGNRTPPRAGASA